MINRLGKCLKLYKTKQSNLIYSVLLILVNYIEVKDFDAS